MLSLIGFFKVIVLRVINFLKDLFGGFYFRRKNNNEWYNGDLFGLGIIVFIIRFFFVL